MADLYWHLEAAYWNGASEAYAHAAGGPRPSLAPAIEIDKPKHRARSSPGRGAK